MASITIRNLDDPLKARLRIRAAHRGIPWRCLGNQERG